MRRSARLSWSSPSFAPLPPATAPRWPAAAALALVLLATLALAAAVRLPLLGLYGYDPDEIWASELAMGRGSVHLALPQNVLMPPPVIFDLHHAAPWWHVWTNLQTTHPPLYYVTLRGWMDLFGLGDASERLFSVAASVAAVAVLFDVVRLLNGTTAAMWAGVLMALSEPQIVHARLTRNYALLMLVALWAANILVRIEKRGVTRGRLVALACALLATMLTHYFCIGLLAALLLYAMLRTHGRSRLRVAAAFAAAAVVFAVGWGPFLWQQRQLFRASDDGMLFLNETSPHHLAWTLQRFALVPATMLVGSLRGWLAGAGCVVALLFVAPLPRLRRRPDLLLWTLWLLATPGFVLLLDLARHTSHLYYARYTLLSGPAVCAMVPALFFGSSNRWISHLLPAIAAVVCLFAIPRVYQPPEVIDPHAIERQFEPALHPQDAMLFVATGYLGWAAGENYLLASRYFHPLPCPVAILDKPANGALLQQLKRREKLLVFTKTEDARLFVPGMVVRDLANCPGRGIIWTMAAPAGLPAMEPRRP